MKPALNGYQMLSWDAHGNGDERQTVHRGWAIFEKQLFTEKMVSVCFMDPAKVSEWDGNIKASILNQQEFAEIWEGRGRIDVSMGVRASTWFDAERRQSIESGAQGDSIAEHASAIWQDFDVALIMPEPYYDQRQYWFKIDTYSSTELNVVTGVFCQSAIDSAQSDQAMMVQNILDDKQSHLQKINALFNQLGSESTGAITYEMFEEKLKSPAVQQYFQTLGLDVWDAWSFFKLLDQDAGGSVEVEEFLMGCLRLRGHATAIDVVKILQDQAWIIQAADQFHKFVHQELAGIKDDILTMNSMLGHIDADHPHEHHEHKRCKEDVMSPAFVGLFYLLNPLTVSSCVALSVQNLQHLFMIFAVVAAGAGRGGVSAAGIALSLYVCPFSPVLLVLPCACLAYNQQSRTQRAKDDGTDRADHTEYEALALTKGNVINFGFLLYSDAWLQRLISLRDVISHAAAFLSVLSIRDLTPNTGFFWYFFIEVFQRYYLLFVFAFHAHILFYPVPLHLRLGSYAPTGPFIHCSAAIGMIALFKPYPTASDYALMVSAMLVQAELIRESQHYFAFLLSGVMFGLSMVPTMVAVWLGRNAGNANYLYNMTLVVNVFASLTLSEWVKAGMRLRKRQFRLAYFRELVLGLADEVAANPASAKAKVSVPAPDADTAVTKLPLLLFVHLKRFGFEARTWGPTWKIEGEVGLPSERLDLQDFVPKMSPQRADLQYDLFAAVDHVGSSPFSGHYTASCRRADGWWRLDDSRTEYLGRAGCEATDRKVIGSWNYLLMFQRRDGPADPEKVPEQSHRHPAVDSFRQDLATTATTLGFAHTCLLHHIQPCGRRARAYMALHAMPEEDIAPPPAPFAAEQRMAARGKIDMAGAFNAAHAEGCECCVPKESALKPGFWRDVGFGEQAETTEGESLRRTFLREVEEEAEAMSPIERTAAIFGWKRAGDMAFEAEDLDGAGDCYARGLAFGAVLGEDGADAFPAWYPRREVYKLCAEVLARAALLELRVAEAEEEEGQGGGGSKLCFVLVLMLSHGEQQWKQAFAEETLFDYS
eukprot:s3353_g6.t1